MAEELVDPDVPEFTETEIVWDEVCRYCGATVRSDAARCPQCGRKTRNWLSGLAFWFVLAALAVTALAAAVRLATF